MVPESRERPELDNEGQKNNNYFDTKELYELLFMNNLHSDQKEKKRNSSNTNKSTFSLESTAL